MTGFIPSPSYSSQPASGRQLQLGSMIQIVLRVSAKLPRIVREPSAVKIRVQLASPEVSIAPE
jgi:hypothetical protein